MAAPKEIWQNIGESFVQQYYAEFDTTNRMGLGNLYVSWSTIYNVHVYLLLFEVHLI